MKLLSAVVLLAGAIGLLSANQQDPFDQSGVPIEKDCKDASATKIVLVAGSASHGPGEHEFFAGCAVLMKLLEQTPNVCVVMARDGWPKDERIFEGAKSLVLFMDGRSGHPIVKGNRMELVRKLMEAKAGFVNLHYAVDYEPKDGDRIINWLGGYYDHRISINPHWRAEFVKLPDHPITRGVEPFSITDEWYYNMNFKPGMKNITPILQATPPDETRKTADAAKHKGREETVAWAYDRPEGGRGFGFTGGHFHRNWGDDNFRRLVVNAILWSAGLEVPAGGAPIALDANDLTINLDRKPGFNRRPGAVKIEAKP